MAPVVQRLDNTIHCINLYPVDETIGLPNIYLLDSDLFQLVDSTIQCLNVQWNSDNKVTKGPKKFGHINRVAVLMRVFFTRKCVAVFARRP